MKVNMVLVVREYISSQGHYGEYLYEVFDLVNLISRCTGTGSYKR